MPRPRLHTDNAARQRAHHDRTQERLNLTAELLLAVRNARVTDDLHQVAQHGDDCELLAALVKHYQARHWQAET